MSSTPFALTPATERILCEALYPFHFLTVEQVTKLLYSLSSKNGVGQHLLKLTEAGYLDRFKLPTGFALQPYIYMLGAKGKKYLAEEKGWEVPKLPSLSVMQTRSNSFLLHLLEVNNFLIATCILHRYIPDVQLLSFEHDIALKKQPLVTTSAAGTRIEVVPDAIIAMQASNQRVLWLEMERGTNKDSDIRNKMSDIYDVFDRRVFQERVGTNRCRVCYVTTAGEADRERLRRVAREVLQQRLGELAPASKRNLIFNFLAVAPLGTTKINEEDLRSEVIHMFLSPVWANPFGDILSPILEL